MLTAQVYVNRTWNSLNKRSLEFTSPVPLNQCFTFLVSFPSLSSLVLLFKLFSVLRTNISAATLSTSLHNQTYLMGRVCVIINSPFFRKEWRMNEYVNNGNNLNSFQIHSKLLSKQYKKWCTTHQFTKNNGVEYIGVKAFSLGRLHKWLGTERSS